MSLKIKIKLSNCYESDPSSGCGSSIGEPNDFNTIYDNDDFNSPYIVKPPSYDNEVTITTSSVAAPDNGLRIMDSRSSSSSSGTSHNSSDSSPTKPAKERNEIFGVAVHSSQESPFRGFGDSPFGKLQRLMYPKQQLTTASANDSGVDLDQQQRPTVTPEEDPSPAKIVFTKFYDTIVEENSCNAVDIQMSNDPERPGRRTSSASCTSSHSGGNPSSELSFNGKIKYLTKTESGHKLEHPHLSTVLENSLNVSQQLSESFILKKYSNEKSPDLFGDDDDEDVEGEAEADCTANEAGDGEKSALQDKNDSRKSSDRSRSLTEPHDNSANDTAENNSYTFANDEQTLDCSLTQFSGGNSSDSYTLFRENCRREREMLRRIRGRLAGVLPPPSVTIPQLDMFTAVLAKKNDILNFFQKSQDEIVQAQADTRSQTKSSSLFRPTHSLEETKSMPWRDILGVRQHGLSYNLNKASESNEYLSLSIMERFIGAETASSYRNSPSSAKKRNTRIKLLCQSPGNRLSHLAKRRAIFSSANLATTSQKSSTLLGPQIMLEKKKQKHRRKATPKRKTPGSKKKNRKTPSSSARKRLFRTDLIKPGPSRENSKRALFQSPAKQIQQKTVLPKPPPMKPELANRVEKSKRALLFTPEKQQPCDSSLKSTTSLGNYYAPSTSKFESLLKRKRNPIDETEDSDATEFAAQCSKKAKADGSGLTPRALKIKSQSFCIGAGSSSAKQHSIKQLPCASISSTTLKQTSILSYSSCSVSSAGSQQMLRSNSVTSLVGAKLQKSHSETAASSTGLTENQKKKLLWAVSQALQERKITAKHESFKQYASILARVVRRIFQEYYHKGSTSNSETMLRLAKKYVYFVTSGSTADDIYLQAKTQIDDTKRQSTSRLSGYVGPEEYQQIKQQSQQSAQSTSQSLSSSFGYRGSTQNLFAGDNSLDSFGLISQSISGLCGSSAAALSQNSFLGQISQDGMANEVSQSSNPRSGKKGIEPCPSLHNSSSKSNLYGGALRENMDCDLRRSGQKNFTGKDQRNMSPYAGNGGSAVKAQTKLVTEIITNSAKARRQISFDS